MSKSIITPKRNRQNIPSRVIVGRISKGSGAEELIDIDLLLGTGKKVKKSKEFLSIQLNGLFDVDEWHKILGPPVKVRFPAVGAVQDVSNAQDAATNAHSHFYLVTDVADYLVNGTSLICTVTFAAGSQIGTFVYSGTTVVNPAQPLCIVCDHTLDATLARVELVFCGDPQ